MHIAINGWFAGQPHVGSGRYLLQLLPALLRADPSLRLSLILPPRLPPPPDLPAEIEILTARGPGGALGKVYFEQRSFPALVACCDADLAHVPYWGPPLRCPVPLVCTVHDVLALVLPRYRRALRQRLYVALVSTAARGADLLLTDSAAAAADIQEQLAIPAARIRAIPIAADRRFHPRAADGEGAALRRRYDLPPDRFILYLGGYAYHKQVRLLLEAYSYVARALDDEAPLVLAGRQPAYGREGTARASYGRKGTARAAWRNRDIPDLPTIAADLGIDEQVHWLGPIAEEDLPALYRQATVFAFPSMYEGFGLMLLEAMQCGTPVVANNLAVFRELAGDAAFLTDNARQMGGALLAILNQRPLRESLSNRGLARATHFSWRNAARETIAAYHDARAGATPP